MTFSLEFFLVYAIPEIVTDPHLDVAYKAVKTISKMIVDTTKSNPSLKPPPQQPHRLENPHNFHF